MILLPRQVLATVPPSEDLQSTWTPPEDWAPGDPIHERPSGCGYSMHPLYDFRDDWEREPLPCHCNDRADWPGQKLRALGDYDGFEAFIIEERALRIQRRLGFTG